MSDSRENGLDVPRMTDAGRPKREYDDRCNRITRLVSGLIGLGCRPRAIELDGLYVEMDPPDALPGTLAEPVASTPNSESQDRHVPVEDFVGRPVRSYRSRAQGDLRNRLRDMRGDVT